MNDSPPEKEKADLRGAGRLERTDDARKVMLGPISVKTPSDHLRIVCRRQVEQLQEAVANIGYRLPFAEKGLKALAEGILEEFDTIPLHELPGIALEASCLRLALERFDAGKEAP